jgi:hypothetical protein
VSGVDPDAGTVFHYSLTDSAGGRFAIDGSSGAITVADGAGLDYEAATSHGIVARATDQGGLWVDRAFTIQLTDVSPTLTGDDGNNVLTGSQEIDSINGLGGDDVLTGGPANDALDGGPGTDIAAFSGRRSDYLVAYDAGTESFTIADRREGSPDGSDTVRGVEAFRFADGTAEYDPLARLVAWTVENSDGAMSVTRYDVDDARPWTGFTFAFDPLGHLGGSTVALDDGSFLRAQYDATEVASWSAQTGAGGAGTHAVVMTDAADAFEWASYSNVVDAGGSLVAQAGTLDNGGHWLNVYDTAGAYSWSKYFNGYDAAGRLVWQSGLQDDGTHWLTTFDPDGSHSWSQATLAFDPEWNIAALGGLNDDGSHLVAPGEFFAAYDTLGWSASAYVPAQHLWPQGQLWGGMVSENAAAGTVVGIVAGALDDGGTVLNFALTDTAGGRFAIDAGTGIVSVASGAQLDYESAASQTIAVRTTDASGALADQTFTIAIGDVNEAPTGLALSNAQVLEHSSSHTVVGTLNGADPDAGAVLTYALTDDAGGLFALEPNSGILVTAGGRSSLDAATAASHGVSVRVTDQAGLSFDKSFTIAVTPDQVAVQTAGGSATTIYDAPDVFSWRSFETDTDAQGHVIRELGITDGGGDWQNEYNGAGWSTRMTVHNAAGALVSQTTNNTDLTHTLLANDVGNTAGWSSFTMQFDPDWNLASITGSNDDGSHSLDMAGVWSSFDSLLWFADPYVVARSAPGGGPDLL